MSYEESQSQIIRNMQSIGIDLQQWIKQKMLNFHTIRVTTHGLEKHFFLLRKLIESFCPQVIAVDPLGNLLELGTQQEVKNTLAMLIDFLKMKSVTAIFTDLTAGGRPTESTKIAISSLMDTWLLLRNIEPNGERNRVLYILKSRGMDHSNQVREFIISSNGINLRDVYVGPGGVLTGTARYTREAQEESVRKHRMREIERNKTSWNENAE